VDQIITRGVWHPEWEEYERTLHASGAFDSDGVEIGDSGVNPVDVMQAQIKREGQSLESEWQSPAELSPETEWTPQTILSAEVTGEHQGQDEEAVLHFTQPYPFFDGHDSTLMREYGCYVGVPISVTLQLLADGAVDEDGIFITETSGLDTERFFDEMADRGFTLVEERLPEPEPTAVQA